MTPLVLTPLTGVPEVAAGDDLVALLLAAVERAGTGWAEGDVLVVSSKVASKALGLAVGLDDLDPADEPGRLARKESVVAAQTSWVVAERASGDDGRGVTRVVKAAAGPVMAAAGVDASNTGGVDHLLLLPDDPDAVARDLRAGLRTATGLRRLGVVLSDTAGRAWRVGQTDFALGAAGVLVADDLRGGVDADGRPLAVTTRAVGDELAAAADLVKGKVAAVPAAQLRGLEPELVTDEDAPGAGALVRTGPQDWFGQGRAEAVRSALGAAPGSEAARRVGLPAAGPEPVGPRLARAVTLALLEAPDAGADVGPGAGGPGGTVARVVLTDQDPVGLGLVTGRLLVALHGEWLEGVLTSRDPAGVVVAVRDRLAAG
ncbi:coenzyme F420-0:L-glutamate ligase [Lapillicoccus jejuensis]|uniref:Coenzyme F420-0:L-glutamate ligase/coenzyme F420-1:gamma-L-glutamate ligase n=1 Tax=Lapillicoccus jejuensis TaxID=402171 RepID=A0A542E2G3_9MICO|nr:coenzyme F420-0:L-glutamate ligase [Lapillicoccus jejuensis]TQJ09521.1 coenzyme F420-0:L-glutamate ligase/coenzyme F420-1:gamma-L-glutamate ligase [Lapillicoccus jejuensis]